MACVIAEVCANYSMFTLDYYYAYVEAQLWDIALAILIPYALKIYWALSSIDTKKVEVRHLKLFALNTLMCCVGFFVFVTWNYLPRINKLYLKD